MKNTLLAALALLLTACSTITQENTQVISLTSTYNGKSVEADCNLTNDKGTYVAKTPSHVTVHKSSEDLNITCKKEGLPDGLLTAISRAAGSMWGNIIFGGGIGAIIDHNNGSGYDYPEILVVKMGESNIVDKYPKSKGQETTSKEE